VKITYFASNDFDSIKDTYSCWSKKYLKGVFMKQLLLKSLMASLLCVGFGQTALANTYYYDITGLDPFIQNWSSINTLPVNDYWGDVISVAGYRGDSLSAGVGVDPQTILNDTPGNVLNVTANRSEYFDRRRCG
jgi:hypothetical protein